MGWGRFGWHGFPSDGGAGHRSPERSGGRAAAARAPGGTRLNARQVSYDQGNVIVDVGPAAASDCPGGWVCLFDYEWWGGRMLQFQSSGYTQNLASYGFDNAAESWVNNRTGRHTSTTEPTGAATHSA